MTRTDAVALAAERFRAMNRELFKTFTLPRAEMYARIDEIQGRYGYKHGWFLIEGHSIPTEEFAPTNQPYMD